MSEQRIDEKPSTTIVLSPGELDLVRTALRLLESTLGREEADELEAVQALLHRLPPVGRTTAGRAAASI